MRLYELAVVIRADISDEDQATQLATIQGWVEAAGGKVLQVDRWGRRRLAYPIAKQRDGYYTIMKAELPPKAPAELERNLRIAENVLRYLITREGEEDE
jgi:small subunit ribosomal protein S6